MDSTTAITFALFLVASFGLCYAYLAILGKIGMIIALSSRDGPFTADFKAEVLGGAACFTYIMGYIFIF